MEPLWSPVVASAGNRSQIRTGQRRPKQAKTVAVGCDRLPFGAHGKQGVCRGLPPVSGDSLPVKEGSIPAGIVEPDYFLRVPGMGIRRSRKPVHAWRIMRASWRLADLGSESRPQPAAALTGVPRSEAGRISTGRVRRKEAQQTPAPEHRRVARQDPGRPRPDVPGRLRVQCQPGSCVVDARGRDAVCLNRSRPTLSAPRRTPARRCWRRAASRPAQEAELRSRLAMEGPHRCGCR
jgi:hypothetical protein